MGNSPKCSECFWYREKQTEKECPLDGWCTNKKRLKIGINDHKREHPPEREAVRWNHECRWWEDAEDRLTHFEVCTRHPEEWRSKEEQAAIMKLLNEGKQVNHEEDPSGMD